MLAASQCSKRHWPLPKLLAHTLGKVSAVICTVAGSNQVAAFLKHSIDIVDHYTLRCVAPPLTVLIYTIAAQCQPPKYSDYKYSYGNLL